MLTVSEALHAAARKASGAITALADIIAPPIGLPPPPERMQAICWDEGHDDPESPCPTCGQGPRRK
jgi:hypothetical protein